MLYAISSSFFQCDIFDCSLTPNFTLSVTKPFVVPLKASEGIIPNEAEDYRPPAELYSYLTNVGEIYEGEKTRLNHFKKA